MKYLLTQAKFNRLMGKHDEEPTCYFPGCDVKLSELIGENVSTRVSRGRVRYYCPEHNPESRRY